MKRSRGGATPSAAAAAASPDARGETSSLKRDEPTATLSPQALAVVFTADVGEVVEAPSATGRIVARVDGVSAGGLEEDEQGDVDLARARLSLEIAQDLGAIYQRALQQSYRARIDEQFLAQATGTETAQ